MAARRRGAGDQDGLQPPQLLHGLFGFAVKRGWAARTRSPRSTGRRQPGADPDIRFSTARSSRRCSGPCPTTCSGATERVLYLAAAMTGLRQGELIALRWRDVDWSRGVIRVRRSYTRGEFRTPKSPALQPGGADGRPAGRRARAPLPALARTRPTTTWSSPSRDRRALRRLEDAQAVQGGAATRPGCGRSASTICATRSAPAMAAAGVPMRTLQEWMGHRDYKTTRIYADYAPDPSQGARWAKTAFGLGTVEEEQGDDAGSAHHRRPLGEGGSNDPANGEALCSRCHRRVECRSPIPQGGHATESASGRL